MQPGDRVMVYDSPGFPVDHYLYATVLSASDAGALVHIDHLGNARHSQQVFVAHTKIRTAADIAQQVQALKQQLAQEHDPDRRKTLQEHIRGQEFVATQLA
jgi:hypothetical protein